jgi:hypothetical protein
MLGSRQAAITGTPSMTTLPQGDLGAVNGHDRHHHHAWVGQDLHGPIRPEAHSAQHGASG